MKMERLKMIGNEKMFSSIIRKALHYVRIFWFVFFVQFQVDN